MKNYLKKIYASRLNSTTVIDANRAWFRIDWIELWQFRDLISMFVEKEFIARYRQTILGPLWYVIQPLIMSGVLTIIFSKIGGLSTDGVPHLLFYLSALVIWGYFTVAFQQTADVLASSAFMFKKVYFPRLVMPISVVISKSLVFFTQFAVFVSLLIYYKFFSSAGDTIHPDIFRIIFLTPIFLMVTALLSLGLGLAFAAITVKYKDLSHVLGFFIQLWFYATPIVYPASKIPEKYQFLFFLNPLVAVIDGFRTAYLGTVALNPLFLVAATGFSLLTVVIGLMMFNFIERDFVDVI